MIKMKVMIVTTIKIIMIMKMMKESVIVLMAMTDAIIMIPATITTAREH